MTWAIYAPWDDMLAVEAGFKETGLNGSDRNKMRSYWAGGLSTWRTAPCIPPEHPCFATDGVMARPPQIIGYNPDGTPIYDEPTCMRLIVMSFGTLADFRSLLRSVIGKNPEAGHYVFWEAFLGNGWAAVDPYPPPAGYWTGKTCT